MHTKCLDKSTARNNLQKKIVEPLKINVDNNSQKVELSEEVDGIDSTIQFVKEVGSINSITPKTTFMVCLETENMELEFHYSIPERIEIYRTPTKKMRYPGDINEKTIKKMSPCTVIKSVKLLRRACVKKDKTIKRLWNEQNHQKKNRISAKIINGS